MYEGCGGFVGSMWISYIQLCNDLSGLLALSTYLAFIEGKLANRGYSVGDWGILGNRGYSVGGCWRILGSISVWAIFLGGYILLYRVLSFG